MLLTKVLWWTFANYLVNWRDMISITTSKGEKNLISCQFFFRGAPVRENMFCAAAQMATIKTKFLGCLLQDISIQINGKMSIWGFFYLSFPSSVIASKRLIKKSHHFEDKLLVFWLRYYKCDWVLFYLLELFCLYVNVLFWTKATFFNNLSFLTLMICPYLFSIVESK